LLSDAASTLRRAPASPAKSDGPLSASLPDQEQDVVIQNQDSYDHQRVQVLGAIAELQAIRQLDKEAADSFNEGLRIARSIKNANLRASALWSIAQAQLLAGSTGGSEVANEAIMTFDLALRDAQGLVNSFARDGVLSRIAHTLIAIAQAQSKSGMAVATSAALDGALRAAQSIADLTLRDNNLRAVAAAQAASGKVVEALRMAGDIQRSMERAKALISIAEALPN
jgi:hypothetical protein